MNILIYNREDFSNGTSSEKIYKWQMSEINCEKRNICYAIYMKLYIMQIVSESGLTASRTGREQGETRGQDYTGG